MPIPYPGIRPRHEFHVRIRGTSVSAKIAILLKTKFNTAMVMQCKDIDSINWIKSVILIVIKGASGWFVLSESKV